MIRTGGQTGSFPSPKISNHYEPNESCQTNIRKRSVCPRFRQGVSDVEAPEAAIGVPAESSGHRLRTNVELIFVKAEGVGIEIEDVGIARAQGDFELRRGGVEVVRGARDGAVAGPVGSCALPADRREAWALVSLRSYGVRITWRKSVRARPIRIYLC